MWSFLKKQMCKFPSSLIKSESKTLSYSEFINEVEITAKEIRDHFSLGNKIVIITKDQLFTAICMAACWAAEVIPIPLSINYGINHCQRIIDSASPDGLIINDVDIDLTNAFSRTSFKFGVIATYMKTEHDFDIPSDVSLLMYTSGTTGNPKGIMLKGSGLKINVKDISEYFDISSRDKILISRPLYHSGVLTGEFLVSLYCGVNIVFCQQKYDPLLLVNSIVKEKISVICGTPNLICHISRLILRRNISHLINRIAISGECLNIEMSRVIREAFPKTKIFNVYGLTEASPRVSYLPADYYDIYPGSVGKPLNNVKYKIITSQGNEAKLYEQGVLYVQAPTVMKGYYRDNILTSKTIIDNWLHTGDIAYINELGLIYIEGRTDDMMIKGGMNIYPKEIEDKLNKISGVNEAVAFGVKASDGNKIVLCLSINPYNNFNLKIIREYIYELLPSYQIPDDIFFLESIPKNGSCKIDRKEIRNIYLNKTERVKGDSSFYEG